jgi:flagellin
MVINTNTSATNATRLLGQSAEALRKSLARLASGSRIVSPEDDAAGLSQVARVHSESLRHGAAMQNLQNTISFLQTRDGYLQKTQQALDRMGELSVLALDATKNDVDRANYNEEFTALKEFINDASTKTFNGRRLFAQYELVDNGGAITWTDAKAAAEAMGGHLATITSSTEQNSIVNQLGSLTTNAWIGATDENTEGTFEWVTGETFDYSNWALGEPNDAGAGEDYAHLFTSFQWNDFANNDGSATAYLVEFDDPLEATTDGNGASVSIDTDYLPTVRETSDSVANATDALTSVKNAISELARQRGDLGASMRRVQSEHEMLEVLRENLDASVSRIADVDVALESTKFARNNILVQSGTAMLAQANAIPQSVLRLLG